MKNVTCFMYFLRNTLYPPPPPRMKTRISSSTANARNFSKSHGPCTGKHVIAGSVTGIPSKMSMTSLLK